jgi:regulator of protease activity HflC (stomatin/prohibitin superfamily)
MDMWHKFILGSVLTVIAASIAGILGGWNAFGTVFLVVWVGLVWKGLTTYVWVRVPELEVALVSHMGSKAFARYLLPGRHLLLPPERISDRISTAAEVVGGKSTQVQTDGGITIVVNWSVTYAINPRTIAIGLWPDMARILPNSANQLLRSHVNDCVGQVISELPTTALTDKGARGRLNRKLREVLLKRMIPFGIQIYHVMVKGIELPGKVQSALEAAHERQVYANSEAVALERLQRAVSQFSDEDMDRLLLLKQIHEIGQHGMVFQMPLVRQSGRPYQSDTGRHVRNGRSRNNEARFSSDPNGGHNEWADWPPSPPH